MDPARHVQLIKLRAFAKSSFTGLQNFIEEGGRKINDIPEKFNKLPDISNKYESAKDELECYAKQITLDTMKNLKSNITKLKLNLVKFYILYSTQHGPDTAHQDAVCQETLTIR